MGRKRKRIKSKRLVTYNRREEAFKVYVEKIVSVLDYGELKHRCTQTIFQLMQDLRNVGGLIHGRFGTRHAHLERGSKILAVAHCDTVQQKNSFAYTYGKVCDETLCFSPKLDDRLGVYTILDILPKLGLELDILLTENEERGQTTAKDFETEKQYNWLVQFDRAGEDVVCYQYKFDKVLKEYFKVGHGSFTCIGSLGRLGCMGVNVGVGYHDNHSMRAYFVVEEYVANLARFLVMYDEQKDTHHIHKQPTTTYYRGYQSDWTPRVYCSGCKNMHPKTKDCEEETEGDKSNGNKGSQKAGGEGSVLRFSKHCEVCSSWVDEDEIIQFGVSGEEDMNICLECLMKIENKG